jgi:lysophospholipase L1-like esterase
MRKVEVLSENFTRTDWYEAENRAVIASGKRPTAVFLGASITKRWNPEQALADLGVVQRGVGGQWPSQYLLRLKSDVLDLKPRGVVIKACAITFRPGVDVKGIRDVLISIVDTAQSHGIQPVLATCVPVREDGNALYSSRGREAETLNDRMLPYNQWLRDLAAERGYPLIDFWKAMADERGFLPAALAEDDIHPNARGYEVMTATARPVIEKLAGAGGS